MEPTPHRLISGRWKLTALLMLLNFGGGVELAFGEPAQAPSRQDEPSWAGKSTLESDGPPAPAPVGPGVYKLDRGDRLRLTFFERVDLNGNYHVSDGGQIRIPQLGEFNAIGKSASELEDDIRTVLERMTNSPANVRAEVVENRPFFVVGLVGKPGAYPFVPGMTVVHGMAIAGGIYRPSTWLGGELIRERGKLQQALEDIKRQMARRARLVAEREGHEAISTPAKLIELVGATEASELVREETEILQRRISAKVQEETSLRAAIEFSRTEIAALQEQLSKIADQRKLMDRQTLDLKELNERGLTNKKSVFDSEMALSLLARDNQETIAAVSRAQRSQMIAERDLAMLTLERNTKIDQEIGMLDEEISKNTATLDSARRLIRQLGALPPDQLAYDVGSVRFEIMRRNEKGELRSMMANEKTPMLPLDVLSVNSSVATPERVQLGN